MSYFTPQAGLAFPTRQRSFGAGAVFTPPDPGGVPANALLETTTGAALLETTTGEYLLETA